MTTALSSGRGAICAFPSDVFKVRPSVKSAPNSAKCSLMSDRLGPISFDDSGHSLFIGRDFGTTKSYSEETAAIIDEEVKRIFDEAAKECEKILSEHRQTLIGVAEYLLAHESMDGEDFSYYCEHGQMPPKEEKSEPAQTKPEPPKPEQTKPEGKAPDEQNAGEGELTDESAKSPYDTPYFRPNDRNDKS